MAIEFAEVHHVRKDELRPVPLFNAKQKIPVGNSVGVGVSGWVRGKEDGILPENRVGTTDEVARCCTVVFQRPKWNSVPITPLEIQSPEMSITTDTLLEYGLITPSRWAPGIWKRVVGASILALGLQWVTAGGAVVASYLLPPIGFGCRSFPSMLYGVAGTSSFFLSLTSGILAHTSQPLPGWIIAHSWPLTLQEAGAVPCRWLGKCVTIASGIGILLLCFFEVMGLLNNCYRNSTPFDKGRGPVVFPGVILGSRAAAIQIHGLAVAFVSAVFFGISTYVGLPARR